jgi:hypothetical protein
VNSGCAALSSFFFLFRIISTTRNRYASIVSGLRLFFQVFDDSTEASFLVTAKYYAIINKKGQDRELLPLMMGVNAGICIAPDETKLDQQIVEFVIPGPWGLVQAI